ncbi:MAG: hypothetical protein GY782_07145 [Gammaproteobacteria bacterium]|nr:hypothetical protein [Gammaproteobacteria bacterium]
MNSCRTGFFAALAVVGIFSLASAEAVLPVATAATQTSQNTATVQRSVGEKINFVQTSQQAKLQKLPDGSYRLVLSGVDHRVLWFADTPSGNAGLWDLSHFIERWSAGSKHLVSASPNATLVANTQLDNSGSDVIKVFEVSNPQYNVQNDTLSYHAKLIFNANHDEKAHSQLYQASLFIDIVCKFGGECF